MNPSIDILPGWKTYIAAAGLIGLAIYQLSQGDVPHAFQSIMAALATFGVRNAIGRSEAATLARHQEMMKRLHHQQ